MPSGVIHSKSCGAPVQAIAKDQYTSIQIGRASAALAVTMVHSQGLSAYLTGAAFGHSLWSFGQAGVDLFFVISGFIISVVLQRPQHVSGFLARRALRVLPFYWFFTLLIVLLGVLGFQSVPTPFDVAISLSVLPQANMPVLGVGWSLEHELIFYLVSAVLLALRRTKLLFIVMASLSISSILLHLAAPGSVANGRDLHLLSLYHLEFFAGAALFRYREMITRLPWRVMLLSGLILFPLSAAMLHGLYGAVIPAEPEGVRGIIRVGFWGLASALLLGGLLASEAQCPRAFEMKPARAMAMVGNASYALYLSHPIVFAVVGICLKGFLPMTWPAAELQAIAIALALGFALLFHHWIEAPFLRLSRKSEHPRFEESKVSNRRDEVRPGDAVMDRITAY